MGHSQGGIIISTWVVSEMWPTIPFHKSTVADIAQDQLLTDFADDLDKLKRVEIYTFASAANHFSGGPFGRIEHFVNTLDFVSRIGKSTICEIFARERRLADRPRRYTFRPEIRRYPAASSRADPRGQGPLRRAHLQARRSLGSSPSLPLVSAPRPTRRSGPMSLSADGSAWLPARPSSTTPS